MASTRPAIGRRCGNIRFTMPISAARRYCYKPSTTRNAGIFTYTSDHSFIIDRDGCFHSQGLDAQTSGQPPAVAMEARDIFLYVASDDIFGDKCADMASLKFCKSFLEGVATPPPTDTELIPENGKPATQYPLVCLGHAILHSHSHTCESSHHQLFHRPDFFNEVKYSTSSPSSDQLAMATSTTLVDRFREELEQICRLEPHTLNPVTPWLLHSQLVFRVPPEEMGTLCDSFRLCTSVGPHSWPLGRREWSARTHGPGDLAEHTRWPIRRLSRYVSGQQRPKAIGQATSAPQTQRFDGDRTQCRSSDSLSDTGL
ncbi:uncharacterized protein MYCFIDRAFT_175609 [Pseudocercospora fijiensis CIRAD86]|uniref:Uncharacterized protein n=1 Tax=Pseudocercospora fijiensis (strain CIRAD86) TaxID=383855 RepID=M3ABW5_PSEFD|nr:uncharacterized protein MYCFIDRAFT_175609 [Pseudocercospora fijiensis CIRAD86]EME82061.1 hypothetical protein MYCFIDRAFT_175609 [Pseudocercospora fijiensis CIRAD86]